jgi:putative flippase GtrA
VPLARLLPERTYRLARELTTYSIVGIANTAIDFALFNGLIFVGWLWANTMSTVVSSTTSYFMNRHWVYHDRPKTALHRGYALFFVVNLFGLAIQGVVLWGLTRYGVGVHRTESRLQLNLFKCVGVVVALFFRFWAYRTFVFKPHPTGRAAVVPGAVVPGAVVSGAAVSGAVVPGAAAPGVAASGVAASTLPALDADRHRPAGGEIDALSAALDIEHRRVGHDRRTAAGGLDINPFPGEAGRA